MDAERRQRRFLNLLIALLVLVAVWGYWPRPEVKRERVTVGHFIEVTIPEEIGGRLTVFPPEDPPPPGFRRP
jgi:hypothetical protein